MEPAVLVEAFRMTRGFLFTMAPWLAPALLAVIAIEIILRPTGD